MKRVPRRLLKRARRRKRSSHWLLVVSRWPFAASSIGGLLLGQSKRVRAACWKPQPDSEWPRAEELRAKYG